MLPEATGHRRSDAGYALIAAITAVAAFAFIAYQVLAADRGAIVGLGARIERARLDAAADAGTMLAIHALGQSDAASRWSIDGKSHEAFFDGVRLEIRIQDERGKVPLDGLNPDQSRVYFENGGAAADKVGPLVDELRSFQSGEDERQTDDQTSQPVQKSYLDQVRQAGFRTVGDLMALKDMDAALFARLANASTVFFEESGPFEPRNAGDLAKATMASDEEDSDAGASSPAASVAGAAGGDDEPSHEEAPPVDLNVVGRTLTVQVVAVNARGAHTHRTAIVELTGAPGQTYWIRYAE